MDKWLMEKKELKMGQRAHTHTNPISSLSVFFVLINGEWNEQERFSIS